MKLLSVFVFLFFATPLFANNPPPDEGMWLPMLIKDYNYEEMKRLGCKLTPEEIYSVNNASLKDAIVQLGNFCTAEIISDEGLILTNHHCGYDAIASQSTEENNYLKDGFWAQNKGEEKNIPGLTVTFLKSMADVSDRIFNLEKDESGAPDYMAIQEEKSKIEAEYSEEGKYTVDVKEMFDGNAFYVFVYEIYRDIRMVGAPPSSIGKFGGDTDNWMWPRHTGDFSMFRIYAGSNNEPADFSESNKPFEPAHSLPVSMEGIADGDFTMVMGYPGTTDRYLTSYEVENLQTVEAPALVKLFEKRLNVMRSVMDRSETLEIENASSYASMSNAYKYYKGQLRGLNKFDLVGKKKIYEAGMSSWIEKDMELKEFYGDMFSRFSTVYGGSDDLDMDMSVVNIAGFAPEFVTGMGISMWRLGNTLEADGPDDAKFAALSDMVQESGEEYFGSNSQIMDREIFKFALDALKNDVSKNRRPDMFEHTLYVKKAKGSNEKFVDMVMKKSVLGNDKKLAKFLKKPKSKTLDKDPGVLYIRSLIDMFRSKLQMDQMTRESELSELKSLYLQAIQNYNRATIGSSTDDDWGDESKPKLMYPDANSTMRVTYGTVKNYKSWEGKPFETFTTGDQILEKYVAGDHEFDVPEKLRTLLSNKDFGPYARMDGKLPVCFLHDTDITGGNSGSPVINAEGHLIGVAFDGNWESMTSDLFWQDEYVRTISVDIRYVLFIIDKFAGASHLLDEMNLMK
ncbi:MAG: S46 family peptidase [Crocinitomicaceae bacterium]|nr:S46 family peptidase [Crocinitomicaceae bacterium]